MNSIKRSYNAKLKGFKSSLISIGFMSLAIVLGQIFLWCGLSETNIVIVFILLVLLTARCTKGYMYGIVSAVARSCGKVLTTGTILSEIWGKNYGTDTQALRALMAGLRRKLEITPAKPRYIITEVGVGYRLVDE